MLYYTCTDLCEIKNTVLKFQRKTVAHLCFKLRNMFLVENIPLLQFLFPLFQLLSLLENSNSS